MAGQLVPVVQAARRPRHSPVNARHGDRYSPAWRIPAKSREINIRAGWPDMRAKAGITAAVPDRWHAPAGSAWHPGPRGTRVIQSAGPGRKCSPSRAVRLRIRPAVTAGTAGASRRRTGGRERLAGAGICPLCGRHGNFPRSRGTFTRCSVPPGPGSLQVRGVLRSGDVP